MDGEDAHASEETARTERILAGRELGRAWKGIDAMRTFFWCNAVVGVVWWLLAEGWWTVPAGVLVVLATAGALLVRRRPFHCALGLAIGSTLLGGGSLVTLAVEGQLQPDSNLIGVAVWIVGTWYAVRHMHRAERLMRAHPELFATRRIKGAARRSRRR